MNKILERERLKLLQREERLKKLDEDNYYLDLEIEQIKREIQVLESRIDYLERS